MIADQPDQPSDSLAGCKSRPRHNWLHVVCAEQEDDEIERRMRLQDRRQDACTVAIAIGEMIVECSRATVQALGNDPDLVAEGCLQRARPSVLVVVTTDGNGVVTPGQRVAV